METVQLKIIFLRSKEASLHIKLPAICNLQTTPTNIFYPNINFFATGKIIGHICYLQLISNLSLTYLDLHTIIQTNADGSLISADRDYSGLKIVQAQALNLFRHFMSERSLGEVIKRYVGSKCYSRNQTPLKNHHQRLGLVFDQWSGTNRNDLFYSLFEVEKVELTADQSDTFLTGRELGLELFAGGQLDRVVGFATANYQDFQRDTTNYLLQQLSRIYFLNPEVRLAIAAKRRLTEIESRELAIQQLAQGRLTRGLLPYSEEDTQTLIRLWLEGTPLKGIADSIGRTVPAVTLRVTKLDLPPRRDLRHWTAEEAADLLRLKRKTSLTNAQIAEVLNRSERAVHHRLIANDVVSFHRKTWEVEEFQMLQELLVTEYSWTTVQQKLAADFPKDRTLQDLQAKAQRSDLALKTEFEIKRAQFEQLLTEGISDRVIAKRLGIHSGTVSKWRKRI